ncbi:unnamed protein product [Phytophthora lilii]|uniref:Unnamed protein product n=1 Tax=Phytophthora lilii TaxID=2077276 RepID=A0A9W7CKX2_9STRA|nr:unnamed protein product [Phytophthora lilii]
MRERDGAVEVCATDAFGAVDSHEHGDSPRDVDAEPGAVGLIGERDLVVDAHAEADHDEGAEELGQTLADVRAVGDEPFLVVLCVALVLAAVSVVQRDFAAVDDAVPVVMRVVEHGVGGGGRFVGRGDVGLRVRLHLGWVCSGGCEGVRETVK